MMRLMMKKTLSVFVAAATAALCVFALAACGASSSNSSTSGNTGSSQSGSSASQSSSYLDSASGEYASGKHTAIVKVKGFDAFEIELDADAAPVTVSNFCKLAGEGFYNNTTFHRIVEDFCLQGGDPDGTGTGGSDQEIVGEFSGNGKTNALADNYKKGTVAMARTSEPNSATSQFFITLSSDASATAALNGQYAAFGMVDKSGMKVVDSIVKKYAKYAQAGSGTIADKADQPLIESIKITK